MIWQVQEAKNRLSEVVRRAREEGPQIITHHGKEVAVVISVEEFRKTTEPQESLAEFMRQSPWAEVEIEVTRSRDLPRDLDL